MDDNEDGAAGDLRAPLLAKAAVPVAVTTLKKTEGDPRHRHRVEVVAPAFLPGGYELPCAVQGRPVKVRVPLEGVQQGETFVADVMCEEYDDDDDDDVEAGDVTGDDLAGHRIPYGRWRDGLCDCFVHGICHPMLWLACCCRPLAIGQILTRMNLTAMGNPILQDDDDDDDANDHGGRRSRRRRKPRTSAFQVVAVVFVVFWAVDYMLALLSPPPPMIPPGDDDHAAPPPPSPDDDDLDIPAWALMADAIHAGMAVLFGAYLLALLIRARAYVRAQYDIPERCCVGCEDCCCSFWLPCCTTLQIARHTADYNRYPAACCTDTGLPPRRQRRNRSTHPRLDDDEPDADGAPSVV